MAEVLLGTVAQSAREEIALPYMEIDGEVNPNEARGRVMH